MKFVHEYVNNLNYTVDLYTLKINRKAFIDETDIILAVCLQNYKDKKELYI